MERREAEAYAARFEELFTGIIRRAIRRRTFAGELPRTQFLLLKLLHCHGSLRTRDLAGAMMVSSPAITALVQELVEAGYVERHEDPEDRRANRIALTDQGREALQRDLAAHRARSVEVLRHFAPEEIETLLATLAKMSRLLSESEEE